MFELLLLVIILVLAIRHFYYSQRPRIPTLLGPKGLPIIGSALEVGREAAPHQTIARWAKKYGPVFTVKMPNAQWIVVSTYEGIYEVLVTKAHEAGARANSFRNRMTSRGLRGILQSNTNSPWWLPQRKAFHRSTRLYGEDLARIEAVFSEITEDLMQKFCAYGNRLIDVKEDLYNFTTIALYVILTGKKPSADDQRVEKSKLIERSLILAMGPNNVQGTLLDAFPILRYFNNPAYKKIREAVQTCDLLWDELWKEAKETYETNNSTCLMHSMGQLMDTRSKHYDPSVTEDNMKAVYTDVIMAGLATTTASLYAFLNILLHYPAVESKLQEEVDRVVGRSRRPCLADRDKMPYTSATIYELLRFTSVVPTLGHITREDVEIAGHKVPAGTICVCLLWSIHHDDKIFTDPWIYKPERFLDDRGNLLPVEHPVRKNLFAFGAGPRICVGEIFALRRLFYVITHIVQTFQLIPPGDRSSLPSCDPRSYHFGWVLSPNNYSLRFKERI